MGFFFPSQFTFLQGPARGATSRYSRISGFVLKASEKLFNDALGADFAFGLVFPCWESWGHTGVMPWDGCKRETTKGLPQRAGRTCQALSSARKEPGWVSSWGWVPALCGTWSLLNQLTPQLEILLLEHLGEAVGLCFKRG